ncbi:MAG: hypothetical protein ACRC80_22250 [Waterburya sp.]
MKQIYYRPQLEVPARNGKCYFDSYTLEPGLNSLSDEGLEFFEKSEDSLVKVFFKTRVLEWIEEEVVSETPETPETPDVEAKTPEVKKTLKSKADGTST